MTKTTEENLSQSKYAEHRNVTKSYIARLVKEGRLHLIKGKLNVEMSDANWITNQRMIKLQTIGVRKYYLENIRRQCISHLSLRCS